MKTTDIVLTRSSDIVAFSRRALGSGTMAATLFLLMVIGALGQGFVSTSPMNTGRYGHVAVRLTDGRVLVAAGAAFNPVTTTEIYDPAIGQWSAAASTGVPRLHGKAVRLADGRVFLGGGTLGISSAPQNAAEIYDPATDSWTAVGIFDMGDSSVTLTLLPDGKVLLVGDSAAAQVFDPASGTRTATQPVLERRRGHSATLLPSGKVLIAGGEHNTVPVTACELYDPATGAFTATGSLPTIRYGAPTVLLSTGEVLRAGGYAYIDHKFDSQATAELYDPVSGSWRPAASLSTARDSFRAAMLDDGRVLAIGGSRIVQGHGFRVPMCEAYDPESGSWAPAGELAWSRSSPTATVLENGQVLVAGGVGADGARLNKAELYDLTTPTLSAVSLSSSRAGSPPAAIPGDVVTLSFTATQAISPPKVTLLGQDLTATASAGNSWSVSANVTGASPHGPATFAIAFQNSAGLEVTPARVTTDGSAVSVDTLTETPTISDPTNWSVSNPATLNFHLPEAPLAGSVELLFRNHYTGELVSTLVLGASQEVSGTRALTFNPLNPMATPDIARGNPLVDGDYSVTISYRDSAGNPPATASHYLHLDTTAPTITSATMYPAYARPGSFVRVTLQADEPYINISGAIGGLPVAVSPFFRNVSVLLPDNVPDGPLSFSITVTDAAGNVSAPITATDNGIYTTVDSIAPVIEMPDFVTAEATSPAGASMSISVTDNLDPFPRIDCRTFHGIHPSPGNKPVFPLGSTQVDVTALDAAGNTSVKRVTVNVVDTTKPAASVPGTLLIRADRSHEAAFGDLRTHVTSSDAVGVVSVVQTPGAGAVYPVGSHPVSFVVSDAAGNSTTVQTIVRIAFAGPQELAVTEGAFTGQDAPAGPPEGAKLSSFGVPAISDLADRATKVGLAHGRARMTGILVEDHAGAQRLAAFQGSPVPGPGASGVTFKSFLDPVLSPHGALAFIGAAQGGSRASIADQGVWTDAFSESLQQVLQEGSEAPGLEGARLKSVSSISLREDGLLARVTLLPGRNGVTTAADAALVLLTGPVTGQALLRKGKLLGGEAGAVVSRFSVLQPAAGSAGHGRWHGENAVLAKVTLRSGEVRIVTIAWDGSVTRLLSTSDVASSIHASARWKSFGLPAMDPLGGTIALAAGLRPLPGVVTAQNDAVLLARDGSGAFLPLAREGAPISMAPGAPAYAIFYDPVVNDQGAVAFLATLRGKGVTNANRTALFAGQPGSLGLVARLGEKVPDETGALTTASWRKFLTYALPGGARPGLLFLAETSGGDTTAGNAKALWGVDSQNKLRRLLRTGAPVVTGGPVLRNLALLNSLPGSFGATRSFNTTGSVAVRATFADGSQSLLRIDLP